MLIGKFAKSRTCMARIRLGRPSPVPHSCANTELNRRLLGIDQPRQRGTFLARKANLLLIHLWAERGEPTE